MYLYAMCKYNLKKKYLPWYQTFDSAEKPCFFSTLLGLVKKCVFSKWPQVTWHPYKLHLLAIFAIPIESVLKFEILDLTNPAFFSNFCIFNFYEEAKNCHIFKRKCKFLYQTQCVAQQNSLSVESNVWYQDK